MKLCEAFFTHPSTDGVVSLVRPEATVLQGLLCESGHTGSVAYCQPCFDYMMRERVNRPLLCHACYPAMRIRVQLLEAINV